MKTIILNGSPRKNGNTAQLLKEAVKGAESIGSSVEYADLYDLSYTGCRGCLACKLKTAAPCVCCWKDDLSPLLKRIFAADRLIIGSPIFLGDITSQVQALAERLCFCSLSYDNYANCFTGKVNLSVILTMNASPEYYGRVYKGMMDQRLRGFRCLNGAMDIYPCCDTMQVDDYSRYAMAAFSEAHKKEVRRTQFPRDLEMAFRIGAGQQINPEE